MCVRAGYTNSTTMGSVLHHWRILAASGFSFMLIVGAYVFADGVAFPSRVEASTESELLQAIATKDSDSDGLPDWAEALYGTSATNPDTRGLGMTDGEAVASGLIVPKAIADIPGDTTPSGAIIDPDLPRAPAEGTLTAAFARSFFTIYMDALERTGGNLSEADMNDVAQKSLAALSSSIARAPDFKTPRDIGVLGSGPEAMKRFAASAEAVLKAYTTQSTESELAYLNKAIANGDDSALDNITALAKAYRIGAAGIAALPVPRELAPEDLALVNALARLSEVTNDFALVNTDPLATMLALQQYPDTIIALANAFERIAAVYSAAGITLVPGAPGASFVGLIDTVAVEQKAAKKP